MPEPSPHYRIGEAAALSGVSAANIRYYEKEGLLSEPGRGGNSYRAYTDSDLHQLRFIRMCRAMDMSLPEVRSLLSLDLRREADCASARETLDGHLGHVRARLAELRSLEKDLKALREKCDGHDAGHCGIIEALHERADAPAAATRAAASRATGAKRHV